MDFDASLAAGIDNLLTIYEAMSGTTRADSRREFDGAGYGKLKTAVVEVVNDRLGHLQAEYHRVLDDRGYLEKLLRQGAEQARTVAEAKLAALYRAVGLRA